MSEHPYLLPWRVEMYNGKAYLRDRAGAMLAEFTLGSSADAELAVQAVNERETLLAERNLADALYEAVYGLYHSSGEEDWSEIEPAMKSYGRARGK